jgi:purine-nucleoside phosphorylase
MDQAAEAVRRQIGGAPRPLVIIGGSGLATVAEAIAVDRRIALDVIPHMPRPTVIGHPGTLYVGHIEGLGVLFFAGRSHAYEGRNPLDLTAAVDLASRLGGQILLATNAAGGVNPLFRPGDLMLLTDHIDLQFRPPPPGAGGPGPPPRGGPGGSPYDRHLGDRMREVAGREKIILHEGVYAATLGPSYETKSEAATLRALGADAVGMSTVPEVKAARRGGFRVAAVSCIANRVPVWGQTSVVTHDEVIAAVASAGERLKTLIVRWTEAIANDQDCGHYSQEARRPRADD